MNRGAHVPLASRRQYLGWAPGPGLPVSPGETGGTSGYRGKNERSMRNLSMWWAARRPPAMAQTTSDWPRSMSPAANTFSALVKVGLIPGGFPFVA